MWLINVVLLQLPAKEGFPVIWVICHKSVIYVTGHVTHGRPPGTWSIKLLNPIKWNLLQLAQWRCPKIILKWGNHIYLDNFVFLFNTDLKRKVNIKDKIFPCKWVNKPKIESEVQGFLIKHSMMVAASIVPSVHLVYIDACKLRPSRLLI